MKTLLFILGSILGIAAILIVMCLLLGVLMTFVGIWITDRGSRKNAKKILKKLPGTDCGDCGCENCLEYAQLVADFRCEQGQCPHISEEAVAYVKDVFYVPPESAPRRKLWDVIKGKFRK